MIDLLVAEMGTLDQIAAWWNGPAGAITQAILLVVLCIAAWGLNLFGLPGNWVAVALIGLYVWLGPEEGAMSLTWVALVIALLAAIVGEAVEFVAGALGAQKAGASRRSTFYSMLGSMIGAIAGAFIGVPIPIIGSIVAAILFGGLGATLGAMYGERQEGKTWDESWTVGKAAFVGRTIGTLGKSLVGMTIVLVALIGVIF